MPALSVKNVRRWTSYLAGFVLFAGLSFLKGCGIFHPNYDYLSIETPIAISKKGEQAVAEYDLPENRNYQFIIKFRFKDVDVAEHMQLFKLLGDPIYKAYAESVEIHKAYAKSIENQRNRYLEALPRFSPDFNTNGRNLWNGVKLDKYVALPVNTSGNYHFEVPPVSFSDPTTKERSVSDGVKLDKYVALPADTSGQIPVHIVVSSLDKNGSVQSVLVDKAVNTVSCFAYTMTAPKNEKSDWMFERLIVNSHLLPGRYRAQVTILDNTPEFDGVDARIAITFYPNERPFN
ncbi:MAG: DUF5625 family protein [Firmicutes bacterium]|nr:DUF5625 family protein [Bacillota bacterium]